MLNIIEIKKLKNKKGKKNYWLFSCLGLHILFWTKSMQIQFCIYFNESINISLMTTSLHQLETLLELIYFLMKNFFLTTVLSFLYNHWKRYQPWNDEIFNKTWCIKAIFVDIWTTSVCFSIKSSKIIKSIHKCFRKTSLTKLMEKKLMLKLKSIKLFFSV